MSSQVHLGPSALGRGLVVPRGIEIPNECRDFPRERLDESILEDPKPLVDRLHSHWVSRKPITVVVDLPPGALLRKIEQHQVETREPYELGPEFSFVYERLRFLLTANNLSGYPGPNQFRLTHLGGALQRFNPDPELVKQGKARNRIIGRSGETEDILARHPITEEPVRLWLDGGPRQFFDPADLGGAGVLHAESIEMGTLRALGGFTPAEIKRKLAADQLAAVRHTGGPARVSAPAGSGKTTVLTEHLRFLQSFENVVAVAYNTGAANEMKARTGDLNDPHIRTLNALGMAVLSGAKAPGKGRPGFLPTTYFRRATVGGPDGNSRVIKDSLVVRLVKEILRELNVPLPPGKGDDFAKSYIEGFRDIRLAFLTPEEAEEKHHIQALREVFNTYTSRLLKMGKTDFDGQIYDALRLMLRNPAVRRQAQLVSTHLLLDEAQDAHPAAIMMTSLLSSPRYSVFLVGDPDQNIYSFMGSNVKFMLEPDSYFPGMSQSTYFLGFNYRCPAKIVKGANDLLSRNLDRLSDGEIKAAPGKTIDDNDMLTVKDGDATSNKVLGHVQQWLDKGALPSSIGVFSRLNAGLLPIQVILRDNKVPCNGPLTAEILNSPGCKPALAWMSIVTNPDRINATTLQSARMGAKYKISNEEFDQLIKRADGSTILEMDLVELSQRAPYSGPAYDFVQDITQLATMASRTEFTSSELLNLIINTSGLLERLENHDKDVNDPTTDMQLPGLTSLREVAAYRQNPKGFEPWLRELLSQKADEKGVMLSTVHKVKGQEYDYTIIWNANEKTFPDSRATTDDAIEAERRLFYVAATRAMKQCVIMGGGRVDLDEDPPLPSRFNHEVNNPMSPEEKIELGYRKAERERAAIDALQPKAEPVRPVHDRFARVARSLGFGIQ